MDTEEAHEGGCVGYNVHDSLLADITKMNLSIKMAKSMTFLTRQALAKMVTTMAMTRSYTRVHAQPNSERITTPYMTKYEKARILGTRALQIRYVQRFAAS